MPTPGRAIVATGGAGAVYYGRGTAMPAPGAMGRWLSLTRFSLMRSREIPVLIPLGLVVALLLTAGCASIAEDYRIADDTAQVRGYTSVSGNVAVGRHAKIGPARTVSGDIEVGAGSQTGGLHSVSGRISLAADVKVEGSVKSVSGDIALARGCTITGDVGTVAGRVTIEDSTVGGDVTLNNGDLELMRSRVAGAVRVSHANGNDEKEAGVVIGPDSSVKEIVVEKDAKVRLRIHRTAKVGPIKGAAAEYYD